MQKVGIWDTFVAERPKAAVVSTKPERPAKEKISKKAQAKAAEAAEGPRRARARRAGTPRAASPRRAPPRRRLEPAAEAPADGRGAGQRPRTRQRPEVKELVEFLCA